MQNGYFKLYRNILNHRYFQDAEKLRFWIWCLLKASHKTHKVIIGNETVILEPGQFITGRKSASVELKISEMTFRSLLKFFSEKDKKLTNKTTNKYTVITVTEYNTYNFVENESNQQSNQQLTNKQPTTNQQLTTYNNDKNVNNDNNRVVQRKFIPPTIDDITKYIKDNNYTVDPNIFLKYFTESNWIDSNGKKVKNWKQKIITWNGRNQKPIVVQKNEFGY